jgi:hypothetical protein
MNHIRRVLTVMATFAGALGAFAATAPAAFAIRMPPPGGTGPTQSRVQTVVVGGMPGWQIAVIAAGTALAAAAAAVLLDRARAARKVHAPTT